MTENNERRTLENVERQIAEIISDVSGQPLEMGVDGLQVVVQIPSFLELLPEGVEAERDEDTRYDECSLTQPLGDSLVLCAHLAFLAFPAF